MFQSNPFYMKISGPYALFTDPMSKANGEKFTYQVPTAQALQGSVEAVYIDKDTTIRQFKNELRWNSIYYR